MNSNGSLPSFPTTDSGKTPMVHHSPNLGPEDAETDDWLYEFIDDVQQVGATEPPESAEASHVVGTDEQKLSNKPKGRAGSMELLESTSRGDRPPVTVVISDEEPEVEQESGGQGGQQSKNRFLDLMASFTHRDIPAKLERGPRDFTEDDQHLNLYRGRLSSTLVYDSDDEYPDPADERSAWRQRRQRRFLFVGQTDEDRFQHICPVRTRRTSNSSENAKECCREVSLVHPSSLELTFGTGQSSLENPRCGSWRSQSY